MDYSNKQALNREQLTRYYGMQVSEAQTIAELKSALASIEGDTRLPETRKSDLTAYAETKVDRLIELEKQGCKRPFHFEDL